MNRNIKSINDNLNEGSKWCCEDMEYHVECYSDNELVTYKPHVREYLFKIKPPHHYLFYYCPWCGTKLSDTLVNEWVDILKKEHGLNDPGFYDEDKLPQEFKTDEWWKKRGL